MKVTEDFVKEQTLEEFADEHELEMVVTEREHPSSEECRYYASFRSVEVKDGCILISAYANGRTPDEAIASYAPEISLKTLVVNAMHPVVNAMHPDNRREIKVPRITRVRGG